MALKHIAGADRTLLEVKRKKFKIQLGEYKFELSACYRFEFSYISE